MSETVPFCKGLKVFAGRNDASLPFKLAWSKRDKKVKS